MECCNYVATTTTTTTVLYPSDISLKENIELQEISRDF